LGKLAALSPAHDRRQFTASITMTRRMYQACGACLRARSM
jgi:hypothetical protein